MPCPGGIRRWPAPLALNRPCNEGSAPGRFVCVLARSMLRVPSPTRAHFRQCILPLQNGQNRCKSPLVCFSCSELLCQCGLPQSHPLCRERTCLLALLQKPHLCLCALVDRHDALRQDRPGLQLHVQRTLRMDAVTQLADVPCKSCEPELPSLSICCVARDRLWWATAEAAISAHVRQEEWHEIRLRLHCLPGRRQARQHPEATWQLHAREGHAVPVHAGFHGGKKVPALGC
mmetsp:Transcript_100609/g.285041  ORF Transcript_100609/g.285041 Transcript_100609/m.285041 type:complete len:232 (+) Transcript_100609:1711-2406(+)